MAWFAFLQGKKLLIILQGKISVLFVLTYGKLIFFLIFRKILKNLGRHNLTKKFLGDKYFPFIIIIIFITMLSLF